MHCSKPLTYAIALNELGSEVVHRYVGQEPSGRMFNELILDHNSKYFSAIMLPLITIQLQVLISILVIN